MEINYNNLNLAGNFREQQRMVHGLDKIHHRYDFTKGLKGMMGAFITIMIGAVLVTEISRSLRRDGII